MKRVNKKAFNDYLQKLISGKDEELGRCVEDLHIQYVNLVKVRGVDKYDLIVSINNIESNMLRIRDLIEYVCITQGIKYNRILVEL